MLNPRFSIKNLEGFAMNPLEIPALDHFHQGLESYWSSLMERHFGDSVLVKWGIFHRTYRTGNRIIKIRATFHPNLCSTQTLKHQYDIWNCLTKNRLFVHPKYSVIGNKWEVLELDLYPGSLLSPAFVAQSPWLIPIHRVVWLMFYLSTKGIFFKQLRFRHMVFDQRKTDIKFIDFGGSEITTPIQAFSLNFSPFPIKFGIHQSEARLSSVLQRILIERGRHITRLSPINYIKKKFFAVDVGPNNSAVSRKPSTLNLNHFPELMEANDVKEHLSTLESELFLNLTPRPRIELGNESYTIPGDFDWNILWFHILKDHNFSDSTVIDLDTHTALGYFTCHLLNIGKMRYMGQCLSSSESQPGKEWAFFIAQLCGFKLNRSSIYTIDRPIKNGIALSLNSEISCSPQTVMALKHVSTTYLILNHRTQSWYQNHLDRSDMALETLWKISDSFNLVKMSASG